MTFRPAPPAAIRGMRRLAGALLLLAAAATAREITGEETWTGEILLEEDVTVAASGVLRIEAGTSIRLRPTIEGGWRRDLVEIQVAGRLLALGTESAPIRFLPEGPPETPPAKPPRPEAAGEEPSQERPGASFPVPAPGWLGIVLHPERPGLSEFRRCIFERAEAAIQWADGFDRVEGCLFLDCVEGIACGDARADAVRRDVARRGVIGPRIEQCRFAGCRFGLALEGSALPEVRRSLFLRCGVAAGNGRACFFGPLSGLGPQIDRCEFLGCGIAVRGSSRIANSIFEGNDLVFAPSPFHHPHVTHIDRFARDRCLYFGNRALAGEDIPLGEGALFVDPKRAGTLPAACDASLLAGDLAPLLSLLPESPARRAATDGGALGMFGGAGVRESAGSGRARILRLERWLGAGPGRAFGSPSALAAAAVALHRSPPAPGDLAGGKQWAVVALDDLLAPGRAKSAATALAILRSESEAEADLVPGIAADATAFWNGGPLALPAGGKVRVRLQAGVNVLLLELAPGTRERLAPSRLEALSADAALPATSLVRAANLAASRPATKVAVAKSSFQRKKPNRQFAQATWEIVLRFSDAPHWLDATNPALFKVLDRKGYRLAISECEPLPRQKSVRLAGSTAHENGLSDVTLGAMRFPDGAPMAFESAVVRLR